MSDEQSIPAESIAVSEEAQTTPSAQPCETLPHEEHAPMIDIHDAHHAASTWKEFFIHIATIVLGLIIAVGLEHTVEYFHQQSERRQLEADLRAEAAERIPVFVANIKFDVALGKWYRAVLQNGRAAAISGGFVTFVFPDRPLLRGAPRPEDGTWTAAEASGRVAVLSKQEIEGWNLVDYYARGSDRTMEDFDKANHDFHAVADRLGIPVVPGTTVRLTPEERDELMRALATVSERSASSEANLVDWQGTSDGAAHGASNDVQMRPYLDRAYAAMPK